VSDVDLFAFRVWSYKQGEVVSLLIHLGDRLGLFAAMAGGEWIDSDGLADRTGLDERWVREWLRGMAAAELLETDEGERFRMAPEAEAVLVDEEHLAFAAGAFAGGYPADYVDQLAESFRTGIGPDYDARGAAGAHTTERMLGPWARSALVPVILPRLDGVVDKLHAGARVLDVGCGSGVAMQAIAEAFPSTQVDGVDLSRHAIDRAEVKLAGIPNAHPRLGRAEDVGGDYDLVLTFDCLHDMTRPADAIAAVRGAIADDGTWLVKEIRCWPTWEQNRKNPMLAMFFGFSITACMASATSEPGGAGLGTVGLNGEVLEAMARQAGFTRFQVHDVDDPANLYYEIRP
jgi:2-polyprenyl-3-methyl-5-hydroxy-6-metoxy-1,4-benzoquinol methylase